MIYKKKFKMQSTYITLNLPDPGLCTRNSTRFKKYKDSQY